MIDQKGNNHDKLGRFAPKGKSDAKDVEDVASADKASEEQDYIYTQKQYNNYGWVMENDVIPYGKYIDFESKFAEAVSNPKSAYNKKKTKYGEYMIAVNDIYDRVFEGVNNTIIYVKGKIENPQITRIVNIDEYDETRLTDIRGDIYETERNGIPQQTGGIFKSYNRNNFPGYAPKKRRLL